METKIYRGYKFEIKYTRSLVSAELVVDRTFNFKADRNIKESHFHRLLDETIEQYKKYKES